MVGVGAVELIGLSHAHVHGVGLAVILFVRGRRGRTVVGHEVRQEGIGARRVVRRIGHTQDVLVLAVREVGTLPEFGQPLLEALEEVLPASVLRFEGQAKAGDGPGIGLPGRLSDEEFAGVIAAGPCGHSVAPAAINAAPASVSTYFWFGARGFSGFVMRINRASNSGFKCLLRK